MEISWITEKGGPCDPTTQKDAGGTPASQLVSSYRKAAGNHGRQRGGALLNAAAFGITPRITPGTGSVPPCDSCSGFPADNSYLSFWHVLGTDASG
jgi:hypothetical protein